jgi:hypothetical protein
LGVPLPLFQEYVDAFVDTKMETLQREFDRLNALQGPWDLQKRWTYVSKILLANKINYLFRSLHPAFTQGLAQKYEHMVRTYIEDHIVHTRLTDLQWSCAQLPLTAGGLGVPLYGEVREAAYIASAAGTIRHSEATSGTIQPGHRWFEQWHHLAHDYLRAQQERGIQGKISEFNTSQEWIGYLLSSTVMPSKLQSHLSEPIQEYHSRGYMEEIAANAHTPSGKELASNARSQMDTNSGYYLRAMAIGPQLQMPDAVFLHAVLGRLGVPPPSLSRSLNCIPHTCNHRNVSEVHINTCKAIKGKYSDIYVHNMVQNQLDQLSVAAGHATVKETVLDHHIPVRDRQERGPGKYNRTDLTIYEVGNPLAQMKRPGKVNLTIDVSITNNGCESNIAKKSHLIQGVAAAERWKTKNAKHKTRAEAAGLTFMPFVMETSGYIEPHAARLVEILCHALAEKRGSDYGKVKGYWMARISAMFHKSIYYKFQDRVNALHNHNTLSKINIQEMDKEIAVY